MLERLGLTREILDRARRSRDARFDGKFFIAVTSTRIYCRTICPAKVTNESNIRYYATAAAASAAGFRPCLRCRPESAPGSPAWLGTSAVVQRALRLIQDGALDESSIEEFAARLGVGVRHLARLFARHVGASPAAIAQTRRLHFAKQLLDETDLRITDIALAAGFGSVRRFNAVIKATYRRPPRELRKPRNTAGRDAEDAGIRMRLTYRPPYDWAHLLRFLGRRAIRGVEAIVDGAYVRSVRTAAGHALLEVRPARGADALELRLRGAEPGDLLSLSSLARRMFDLSADPAKIAAVLARDPQLDVLVRERPGLRIPGTWEPFESGVRAILGQQVSVAGGVTLLARVVERAGEKLAAEHALLDRVFPTAAALARCDLDGLGLTRTRAASLHGFARAVRDGAIDFSQASNRVSEALRALPGVGPWTAGYAALRGLGEPDAFPSGDLILRRQGSAGGAPLAAPALEARADSWRPFRGYAVMHLWEAAARAPVDAPLAAAAARPSVQHASACPDAVRGPRQWASLSRRRPDRAPR